jgi:CelD/BcsL family acetyltransferase involved in cellulose biosynthesis
MLDRCEWIDDATRLASLRSAWDGLHAAAGGTNVFLTHAWLTHWFACFGYHDHAIVVQRSGDRLVAALPVERSDGQVRSLEEHTYLSELLHADRESVEALLGALSAAGHRRLCVSGPANPGYQERLEAGAPAHYVAIPKYAYVTRSIAVFESMGEYLASRPRKVRAELRRKLRRLERERPAELVELRRDQAERAWSFVTEVEGDSWKQGAGTAILCHDAERRFYRGLLELETPSFETRLHALVHRDEPLAYVLSVVHGGRMFALKTSYRAELQHLSLGLALFCHVEEALAGRGELSRIELLGRDARYKRELATDAEEHCSYELRASGLAAHAYAAAHEHLRPAWHRLAARATTLIRRAQPAGLVGGGARGPAGA